MKEDIIYTEATNGNVVKFEKAGDFIEGVFIGYEESRQFKNSYALRFGQNSEQKVVFVSGIVIDLLKNNNIEKGRKIKIVYTGKEKNQTGTFSYNTYKLFFSK